MTQLIQRKSMMMRLTCSAPRKNQKQPTERQQHLMPTFPTHTKHSHPCFCCVYNIRGAINAFQQRLVPTLCVVFLTDKLIFPCQLRNAQSVQMIPGVFFRCPSRNNVERIFYKVQSILRNSQGISLTKVDCVPP